MRSRISPATALPSRPGAIVLAARSSRPRFCMSARTASSAPGDCTFPAPEHLDHLRGGVDVAPVDRLEALVARARDVERAREGGARRLAADQPAELGGAPDPTGRDRLVSHALSLRIGCWRDAIRVLRRR